MGRRTPPARKLEGIRSAVIYFLLLDRFASSRGPLHLPDPRYAARRWRRRCGGDLSGLKERLGYIKGLGAEAVWMTPIVENVDLDDWDGFHGYWAKSFDRLDPRWGNLEELDQLCEEARRLELDLILDVVVNHTSPIHGPLNGALHRAGRLLSSYDQDRRQMFHHLGDLDQSQPYDPELWQKCNVHGLADLNQRHPVIDEYLKTSVADWIRRGFSGVRLDTARHVCPLWLREFLDALPPLKYQFAEWWGGGHDDPHSLEFEKTSGFHLTDFGLAQRLRAVALGQSFEELAAYLEQDSQFADAERVVTFVDNHDMPRLLTLMLASGMDSARARARLQTVLSWLFLLRGVPAVYYGTEQYLHQLTRARGKAMGDDPYNREVMRSFEPTPLYRRIAKMAKLRNSVVGHPTQLMKVKEHFWHARRGPLEYAVNLGSETEHLSRGRAVEPLRMRCWRSSKGGAEIS